MNRLSPLVRPLSWWFFVSVALVALCFSQVDMALARHTLRPVETVSNGLKGLVLVGGEMAVSLGLLGWRVWRGPLGRLERTLLLACLASMGVYAFDSLGLKVLFGVPNPGEVLGGLPHAFHLLQGTPNGSFPSGHMALAGAFAGVFMWSYRSSRLPLAVLLAGAGGLLVLGGWHFVSDVIGGVYVGLALGMLAGAMWGDMPSTHKN